MERISRQMMFMQMTEIAAQRSTCYRGNIGSLIVSDNDILAMGYNGSPAGEEHCRGNECPLTETGGCKKSVHAEWNAIERAKIKMWGVPSYWHDCDIYCSQSPCPNCAQLVISVGIKRVFYRHPYRLREGIDILLRGGAAVYRVTPAGIIIEEPTGKMVTL